MKKENQMLARLSKMFADDEQSVEIKAAHAALLDEYEGFKAEANALIAHQDEQLLELQEQLAQAVATAEQLQSCFDAVVGERDALLEQIEEQRANARKEKIVAAIGTEKAGALFEATEGLDDAAFEAVVSALVGSVEVETKSELFKEVGVAAQADATKVEESAEMRLLKQKYGAK